MKNSKNLRKGAVKSKNSGITLIALVVTIIVLLILAGISISMLSGDNGILTRTTDAKEKTDISSIEERAQLVKLGLQIDNLSKPNTDQIKRNTLVSAIQKEFEGSITIGSKVTTADNRYDIIVDNDLKITVLKHQETNTGTIALPYEVDGDSLVIYPTISNFTVTKSYDEYVEDILNNLPTGENEKYEKLTQYAIKSQNYYANNFSETWNDISDVIEYWYNMGWIDSNEFTSLKACYEAEETEDYPDGPESWLNDWGILGWADYLEEYGMEVTVMFNGKDITINLADESEVWFEITKSGEFEVTAIASNGSEGTTIVTIEQFYALEPANDYDYYGRAWMFRLKKYDEIVPIIAEFNPKMKVEGIDEEYDLSSYIYDGNISIGVICDSFGWGIYKNATITLNINGEEVVWNGIVGSIE